MKVKMKKFPTWIGPYQLCAPLRYIGVDEETRDRIAEFLSETPINTLCQKIYQWRCDRRVSVKIDYYDAWSADEALTPIILPLLKQVQKNKDGGPNVDDEDVPEYLRRTASPPTENEWDTDDNWFARWDYVLEEMIWAFEQHSIDWEDQFWVVKPEMDLENTIPNEDGTATLKWKVEGEFDSVGRDAHYARMKNGMMLFGKYYDCLWT